MLEWQLCLEGYEAKFCSYIQNVSPEILSGQMRRKLRKGNKVYKKRILLSQREY